MELNSKFPIPSLREYVQSLRNIHAEWSLKTPLRKWCYLYGIGKMSGKLIGIPVFEDDQSLSWYSYMGYIYYGICTALAIYTIVYYSLQGEMSKGLPCTCMLVGPSYASLPFLYLVLSKRRYGLHNMIDFGGKYIFPDHHDDENYIKICSKQMNNSMRSFLLRFVAIIITFVIGNTKMNYATIVMGIKTTMLELKIPFTEEKSNEEFVVNYIFQTIIAAFGFFGFICMEIAMEISVLPIFISPQLIAFEIKKLSEKFEKGKPSFYFTFRNIVQQVMDIDNYKITVASYFYWRSLIAPPAFTYSIAMSIFCEYMMKYPVGYFLAIISYVQLYFLCSIAETFKDDGICEVLYDTKWYLLSIEHQRVVMHLIRRKQNGTTLSIGPFAKLNFNTFSIVSKNIYSALMFLFNFSK